jgi:deoxyribonuclease V
MHYLFPHQWPTTRDEAFTILQETSQQVVIDTNTPEPQLIAGVETDYGQSGDTLFAAAVVVSFPDFHVIERALQYVKLTFPYYPNLVFFREGQAMVNALAKLKSNPDLLMIGGHGIAHPQGCGPASHLGVMFDRPAIGCARRILAGQFQEPDTQKGSAQPILLRGREVGVAYRSKDGVKPIFISPAHRCDLAYARRITVQCLREYRMPEPLRIAHLEVNNYRRRSDETGGRQFHERNTRSEEHEV